MTNAKRFPADEAIHHTGQRGPMVVLASDHDAETDRLQRHLDSRNEQIDGYERQLGIDKAGAEHTIGSEIEQLRGNLSLAEEGLANYTKEVELLRAQRDSNLAKEVELIRQILEFLRSFISGGVNQDFKPWARELYSKLYSSPSEPCEQPQSRSVQRRIAAMKGEQAPEFGASRDLSASEAASFAKTLARSPRRIGAGVPPDGAPSMPEGASRDASSACSWLCECGRLNVSYTDPCDCERGPHAQRTGAVE